MRLLITTQIVDKNDTNLGFFHTWIEKITAHAEHVYVICLKKGEYDLPKNVTVMSLGKEQGGVSSIKYAIRFWACLWRLRGKYNNVFVHMNPEYVILGGIFWRLQHKKVLLWYTHKAVNIRLRLGTFFASKIFTASKESFRLPSKKVEVVGHGISTVILNYADIKDHEGLNKSHHLSLLSVGRITPAKDWEIVIRGVAELQNKKVPGLRSVYFLFAGRTINQEDEEYYKHLVSISEEVMHKTSTGIVFNSYRPEQMQHVYQGAHILIHTSRTGSMDKVVLEALAAGRIVVTSSEAYVDLADGELKDVVFRFTPGDYQELAKIIENIYEAGILKTIPNKRAIEYVRAHHNLDMLIEKISAYLT